MEAGRQRQFRIHHCLGRGGYGEVYRATMVAPGGLSSEVAVKLLRVDVDPGGEAVRRLRDEGRVLSVIRHPAILRVFDLALLDGRIGLVTEYVEGQDLSGLIGVLSPRACLRVTAAVAEALHVAWSDTGPDGRPLRLVHRDIKPSNIRIGRHGEVKVLDFGIARSMDDASDREARTGTGSAVGSLAYMAPERFGRAPAAPAADVFGLGCTLYEMFAGRRLFVDPVPVEMFRLAAEASAFADHLDAALAALPPEGSGPEVRDLLASMLAHDPAARPTAAEVRARAEALAERAEGVPLRRWARERVWPDPNTVNGALEGRVITEGTLSSASFDLSTDRSSETYQIDLGPSLPTPPVKALAPSPRRGWRIGAAAVGLAAVGLVGLAAAQGAVTFDLTLPGRTPVAAPMPVPAPPPVPRPRPRPRRTTEPAPAAAPPLPVVPAPTIAVAPAPAPEPELPELPDLPQLPEPEPTAPPPAPDGPPGRVVVQPATVRIELHLDGRSVGPGEVGPGRYELFADFGYGLTNVGKLVDVVSGYQTVVRCNPLRHTCDVAN